MENIHLEDSERGLLFGMNTTNTQKIQTATTVPSKKKTTARRRAKAAESKKPAAPQDMDFWIEIPA